MDEVCAEAQLDVGHIWMWLDGITYDDWQLYHGLHDMTGTIKQRIHLAGAGSHFQAMADVQETAEVEINDLVKGAVSRLAELKEIGPKRILSGDASEEFRLHWAPGGVESVVPVDTVEGKVNEVVDGTQTTVGVVDEITQGVEAATGTIASAAEDVATQISGAVYGNSQSVGDSLSSQVSEPAGGEEPPFPSEIVSSAGDIPASPTDTSADAVSWASEAVLDHPHSAIESVVGQSSEILANEGAPLQQKIVSAAQAIPNSASTITSDSVLQTSTLVLGRQQATAESVISQGSNVAGDIPPVKSNILSPAQDVRISLEYIPEEVAARVSMAVPETPPGIVKPIVSQVTSDGNFINPISPYGTGDVDDATAEAKPAGSSVTSAVGDPVDSISSEEIVIVKERLQKAFKLPDSGVGEKLAADDEMVDKGSSLAPQANEKVAGKEKGTVRKGPLVPGNGAEEAPSIIVEVVGTEEAPASVSLEVPAGFAGR